MSVDIESSVPTKSPEEHDDYEDDDPSIPLVVVYVVVPNKARDQTENPDNDDADDQWKCTRVDRSKGLTTEDHRSH